MQSIPSRIGKSNLCRTIICRVFVALVPAVFFAALPSFASDRDDADKAHARRDFAHAASMFRKAALQGDAVAQFKLGGMYLRGEGVPQNHREAAMWFEKSAAQGNAMAQNSLGVRYTKGEGVARNPARAATLYREAAEQRFALAQDNLADLYAKGLGVKKDVVLAHLWSSLATANGEGRATGKRRVLARKMTKEQLAEATTHLGIMFMRGRAVAQNIKRAVPYFQSAAAQGYLLAQFELAECYARGNGLTQDYTKAASWYEKSAAQGYARAQSNIAFMLETGQGVGLDAKRAAYWYAQAAAQGDTIAQYNLGAMFESGRGIAQDHIEAYKWISLAEAGGNKQAADSRRLVESLMSPEQITDAQKRVSEWKTINAK